MSEPMSRPGVRRLALAAAAATTVVGLATPVLASRWGAVHDGPVIDSPSFKEVGRIHLDNAESLYPNASYPDFDNGWLILDPGSRRGYTLVQGVGSGGGIYIESFDLDTLRPLQRVAVPGLPVTTGNNSNNFFNGSTWSGEVVHAIDPVAHRIYLPVSYSLGLPPFLTDHGTDSRPLAREILILDEDAFDTDPVHAFGRFSYPPDQARLYLYPLLGLTVSRWHVPADKPGKLLAQFASPLVNTGSLPAAYDHILTQWDTSGVPMHQPLPEDERVPLAQPLAAADWTQVLTPCATAPVSSANNGPGGTYQKGILARRDAVYVQCQSAPGSGAVVRVPVDPTTGLLSVDPATGLPVQQFVSLGKPVGDVLVDDGAGRMFLRSFGDGVSWWAFDAADMRFTGAIAAHPKDGRPTGAGVDPTTGRLYTLDEDDCIPRAGGGFLPTRGGLRITDAGLDPIPASQAVLPELAYPSIFAMHVDPVTRRVYLRRGVPALRTAFHYPDCPASYNQDYPAPDEYFWRVYEDRVPLPGEPRPLDDSTLTTNSAESADRTEASFLGSGSGYGARSLLVGGLDAVTNGEVTALKSPCGTDDREALFGSVGSVEVSDSAVSAEAAALDADARTQNVLGDPTSRCRPQSGNTQLDHCYGDVHEFAFDQAQPGVDRNGDGCTDRDGENRYAASCLGSRNEGNPGFDDDEHTLPRDGFEARASCDDPGQKATGSATGALSSADQAVTVDESSSTVDVVRKANKGVVVKVDSVARGVTIKGQGTIGLVRNEATSTSTGRDGGAFTSFKRTVCDVDVAGVVYRGCFGDEDTLQARVKQLNQAMGGYAEIRLRMPDPTLAKGTPHGYLAAVQRDAKQRFGDQVVAKDRSLAVPALEIVSNRGDGGKWGAGRQIYQLAGAQASTSYGIACTYGRSPKGGCAGDGEASFDSTDGLGSGGNGGTITNTVYEQLPGERGASISVPHESTITRLLRALPRAIAQALRLLFNNPRELGLLAALWGLLYAPCYLGDRRRAVRSIAARRLSTG